MGETDDGADTTQDLVAGMLKEMTVRERDNNHDAHVAKPEEKLPESKGNMAPSKFRKEANRRKANQDSAQCVDSKLLKTVKESVVVERTCDSNSRKLEEQKEDRKGAECSK